MTFSISNMIERYSSKEMTAIFSEEHKFENFLKIEEAVVEAYVRLGVVPNEDYEKIVKSAHIDVKRIHEIEDVTKHDVIAFTRSISEMLGEEKKWIHYSLTSTDVVDSAQSLTLKEANTILSLDLEKFKDALLAKAKEYKDQPIMGRTHGMHAEITSFGLKFALYYDELKRDIERFYNERKNIEVIKLSGAVGNYANVPMEVEEFVANKYEMDHALISTQVLSRDRHAGYIYSLASIASLMEKVATEIRHLSRTEIHEVEEYFAKGQKGSSAMPHKRNPIGCENICGTARVVKSYVQVALEDNTLWHERDISHSSAERIILPDAITLIDYMLKRLTRIINNLTVFPERMLKNIELTNGVVFSGYVLTTLINKGTSREKAYDLIQPLAFIAAETGKHFKNVLMENEEVMKYLSKQEILDCFNLNNYLKNTDKIYERLGI